MSKKEKKGEPELQDQIEDLKEELAQRNEEVSRFRRELGQVHQRLEKVIAQVAGEHEQAKRLQKILSPTEVPRIGGVEMSTKFVPGSQAGGDYLDVFEYQDRLKFGILVSSASGYAISSLLLNAIFAHTASIQAKQSVGVREFVSALAGECQREMSAKDSFSFFYGEMDRRNFEMSYVLLGSLDAFHQNASDRDLIALIRASDRVTKESPLQIEVNRMTFEPRDRLIVMTEGVRNSQNDKGEFWGVNGVLEAIEGAPKSGVHDLRNEILYRNESFSGNSSPLRDQTLVIMEAKDRQIKLAP